jgi:competence protein ComEA
MLDLWDDAQRLWQEKRFILISSLIGCIIIITGAVLLNNRQTMAVQEERLSNQSEVTADVSSASTVDATIPTTVIVDVKGAVKSPGVYDITEVPRIQTAIVQAGGATSNADMTQVNLAAIMADGQVVYVPHKGEEIPLIYQQTSAVSGNNQGQQQSTGMQVAINTADATQLQQLDGVGPKKADKIIAYREANGPFQIIDDLKNVDGFGEKSIAAIADQIIVP